MTNDLYAEDQIRLLLRYGRVTHIVTTSPDSPLSPLGLVQRCLSANIEHAVPLGEGSAAIYAPNGVPRSLGVFDIRAEEIDLAKYADCAQTPVTEHPAAGEASDEAEGATPESPNFDNDDTSLNTERDDTLSTEERELSNPAPDLSENWDEQARSHQMEQPGADASAIECSKQETVSETTLASNGDASSTEDLHYTGKVQSDEPATDPVSSGSEPSNENAPSSAERGPEIDPLKLAKEIAEAMSQLDGERDRCGTAHQVQDDPGSGVSEILAASETIGKRLSTLEARIEDLATKPFPRPDTSGLNALMSRFAAGLSVALRRLEDAVDTLESGHARTSQSPTEPDDDTRAQQPEDTILRELGELASLQHMTLQQVATLIDATGSGSSVAQEAFLNDLRHAIAEIIAEQKLGASAA